MNARELADWIEREPRIVLDQGRETILRALRLLAAEELARLRARLEIDFATDGNGKRVPFPTGGPDGIACRDETIRILESALAESERKCERLRFHAEAMYQEHKKIADEWNRVLDSRAISPAHSATAYRAEFKEES